MALVDYGSGSDSDDDIADQPSVPRSITNSKGKKVFHVAIPSQNASDSDDDETCIKIAKKPKISNSGGGGLFAMLPAPKSGHMRSMGSKDKSSVPVSTASVIVLESTGGSSVLSKKTVANNLVPLAVNGRKRKAQQKEDDTEDDDGSGFLASLSKGITPALPQEGPSGPTPHDEDHEVTGSYEDAVTGVYGDDVTGVYGEVTGAYEEVTGTYEKEQNDAIDTEAIRYLEGRRLRKNEIPSGFDIIDVNASSVAGDTSAWASQYAAAQPHAPIVSLSEMSKDDRNKGNTKRKNQITHLAAHALANKQALEAKWATQRASMRGGANKYGF
eukprot:CFRG1514T1